MRRNMRMLPVVLVAMVALIVGATAPQAWAQKQQLDITKIYWEYNSTPNDLGVHVFLDGEWKSLKIINPNGRTIFEVEGKGPYAELGLTELFFEGAEPPLDEVPLEELLDMFPEGNYKFQGKNVDGADIESTAKFSHAIPAGPAVSSEVDGNKVVIKWNAVTGPPPGFPNKPIKIVGYQVIVESFQVTLPASARSVTVPPEFVASLSSGKVPFEVLAIEASGNQTITEGTFTK